MFTLNPSSEGFIDSADLLLKSIGAFAAAYGFYIGLKRYKKAQSWKRMEWVANEVKAFIADPMVRNAMYMLDWGTRHIELYPQKTDYDDRFVLVDRQLLNNALQVHELRDEPLHGKTRFTKDEIAIRDIFDHFLSSLGKFNQFIEAGLITCAELKPYLIYWIDTISNELHDNTRIALHDYIQRYKFVDVQKFFENFDIDITTEALARTEEAKLKKGAGCG
ncbi:MAG: hypothetical protein H7Y86_17215 [Rhizobacter sp.]|nr:hypothetical protein [Ferruginibacter sp.]